MTKVASGGVIVAFVGLLHHDLARPGREHLPRRLASVVNVAHGIGKFVDKLAS